MTRRRLAGKVERVEVEAAIKEAAEAAIEKKKKGC
jgi:hypothetical protein